MEVYFEHIPYFLLFVGLGIAANLLKKAVRDKEEITPWRYVEEIFGGLWIALVVAGALDYFTPWSAFLIYGISSVAGYFHSYILDYVAKGLIEFIVVKAKSIINGKADELAKIGEEVGEEPNLEDIDLDEES